MNSYSHIGFGFAIALAVVLGLIAFAEPRADDEENVDGDAVCLQPTNFREDGAWGLTTSPSTEELRVDELRWAAHEGCGRFVIDIATDEGDSAAHVGEVSAEFLRDFGIVRVHLHDVENVNLDEDAAADIEIEGDFASRGFTVRANDNSLFVDLHIASEVEAAVTILDDPARVVVDLRPGGGHTPVPAAMNDLTVLVEPREGDRATYPLTVSGYARHFEANVVIRFERHGEQIGEDIILTATDWAETWGSFGAVIDTGPVGLIELHVGEYSAADGSWEGVSVDLHMGDRSVVPMIARGVEHE